jgi:hypothetical protein
MKARSSHLSWFTAVAVFTLVLTPPISAAQTVTQPPAQTPAPAKAGPPPGLQNSQAPSAEQPSTGNGQNIPQTPYERIVVPGIKRWTAAHAKPAGRSVAAAVTSAATAAPNFGGFVAAPKFVAGDLTGWDPRSSALVVFASGDFNDDGKPDIATVQTTTGAVNVILNQTPAAGGLSFSAPITTQPTTVNPRAAQQALAIDVNGDGYDDLLLLDAGNNCIDVLINQKNGTFAPPVQVGTGNLNTLGAFAAADLNGDGHPDLLLLSSKTTGSSGNYTTTLEFDTYMNDGSGNFMPPTGNLTQIQTYSGTYLVLQGRSIVLTDVNNDGKPDATVEVIQVLTTLSPDINHVVMTLLGTGTGAFQMPNANNNIVIPSNGTANIGFPLVANLNLVSLRTSAPNTKDIVFSYQDYNIYVVLGNGDGTYGQPYNVGLPGAYPTDLWVADLNGDGIEDLVDAEPAYLAIYTGRGDGTFDLPTVHFYGSGFGKFSVLSIADFNGDGLPDAALMNFSEGSVTVFPSLADAGPSVFAGPLLPGNGGDFIQRVLAQTVLDANGDGNDDIFFYSAGRALGNPSLVTALGDGKGNFFNVNAVPGFISTTFNFAEAATGDFNGDGLADIVLHTYSGSGLTLLLSNGDGTFTQKPISLGPNFACITNYAAVGDVNGDGKLDLVVAYQGDSIYNCNTGSIPPGFFVLLGNGDGTFQPATFTALGSLLYQPVLVDLNGDGKLDLVVSDTPYPPVSGNFYTWILLGNGDGTFGPATSILPYYLNNLMLVGDLNGDGHPDLVVMSQGLTDAQKDNPDLTQAGVQVLLGDGKGNLTLSSTFLKGFYGAGALADYNGDGKLDLLLSEVASFNFTEPFAGGVIGLGNGDGTFTAVGNYEAGASSGVVLKGNFLKGNAPGAAFASGSSGTTIFIGQGGTTETLSAEQSTIPAGGTATFNVSLTPTLAGRPTPTGTVTLFEGTTNLASGTLSGGSATIAVSGLAVGSNTITAAYSGDSNFNLNSAQTTIIVAPAPSLTLAANPTSLSLARGQTGVVTLTVTANSSFSGSVTIAASGGPTGVTVVVNPGTLTLQGGQSATASVVISTVQPKNARLDPPGSGPASQLALAGIGLGLLLLIPLRRRAFIRLPMLLGAVALSLAALGSISGCGGSSYTVAPPGSGTITITAQASGITAQTVSISVTIH